AQDHYRPLPLLALHERLYPGMHFNPDSSPDQLHQLFRRLRRALALGQLALSVREHRGAYALQGEQPLLLHRDESPGTSAARTALAPMDGAPFSSSEFARRHGISKPTAVTRIRELVGAGVLTRIGSGPRTKYQSR